ncbi:MAG: hypothetical protein U5J95_00625 [Balneolaceae bacterium]|nr:hypothetical protein [Balneolaceae bacterium]
MSRSSKLHIYEEGTNVLWGLVVVVTTALATYILANTFVSSGWQISGLKQVTVLLLFTISFIGIFKISDPLLRFVIFIENRLLKINVFKGDEKVRIIEIDLSEIEALKFAPHYPRSRGEALFDFSTSYHLMWRPTYSQSYEKLIDLGEISFTLKVEDIAKIIRLIREHNANIEVPAEQQEFFGI